MNKKIQHIRALAANTAATAAIALLMLAPTACVNTIPGYEDPEANNPEAGLDPATPVALTATLGAYGAASPTRAALPLREGVPAGGGRFSTRSAASPTRAASTIPAEGEITAASTLTGDIDSEILLYGIATNSPTYKAAGTVGAPVLNDAAGNTVSLIMSDFNTSATNAKGDKQRHSRLGSLHFNNSQDALIGFANRTYNATTKSAAYTFALRHTTAKVSVLVVDAAGVPINLTDALDTDATKAPKLTAYKSESCCYETENTTAPAETQRRALGEYMATSKTDGSYPSTTTANAAFACIPTAVAKSFDLKQPTTGTNLPTNLMNVIVHTNPTVKKNGSSPKTYFPAITPDESVTVGGSDITAIATGLSGANNPVAVLPFDATAGTTNPHRITLSLKADAENGSPAGTYGINLTDIVLTGLPAGDGRIDPSAAEPARAASTTTTGTLRYLLPGEHMVVTLKIDRNKILSATATLAPWTEATANGDNLGDADIPGGDSEMVVPFGDKQFSAALAKMKFNADGTSGGTLKLTLNANDCIDITNAANLTLISKIKSLEVGGEFIQSLAGIELFTALTSLVCYNNKFTTLDVSKNTKLTNLECFENKFTTLDVSQNTALTYLDCADNKLTTLDVSQNTKLTHLNCKNNTLTTLDASSNTELQKLYCSGNRLATFDASKIIKCEFQCGNQTTDGTTAQTVALTLSKEQEALWDDKLSILPNNANVTVTYNNNSN